MSATELKEVHGMQQQQILEATTYDTDEPKLDHGIEELDAGGAAQAT
jgi:hypothetical protein